MSVDDYVLAVKAKLDEISPFEEPLNFIDENGDATANKVKPIVEYIKAELSHASEFCLNDLPLSLLAKDADYDEEDVVIDPIGIGHIEGVDTYKRLVRVRLLGGEWRRDCTAFITSSDADYIKQQNIYTRGGVCKPVVVVVPEKNELELYSFHTNNECCHHTHAHVFYINPRMDVTRIKSDISDFIVLKCAAMVSVIMENPNGAQAFLNEYNTKLNSILK